MSRIRQTGSAALLAELWLQQSRAPASAASQKLVPFFASTASIEPKYEKNICQHHFLRLISSTNEQLGTHQNNEKN